MKDETLLPDDFDFDRFNDVVWLEVIASNPHMHSITASTIAMVALELNRRLGAALQSGNSAQPEPVNKTYKLPPNSFSDDELMGMAHGDNPAANAYRELLEFRRNAANGNPGQPVTVPAGYALVPVEPTPEMLTASYVFAHIDNTADSWKAMLAAAPKGV